jgi:prolyl oligopeptidase
VSDDPFLWLEEVEGERALDWVRAENARTLADLQSDPRYDGFREAASIIVNAADRIPYSRFIGDGLANFWQDETHVRGLWRRTTLASFKASEPEWEPILDVDALAGAEGRNWVFQGGPLLRPQDRLCLVALSNGGKDAAEWREYDLIAKRFVEGGFCLPESKQNAAWIDADALLVARDWGPGTMTTSGYPFVLKRWRRGTPLDAAEEIFRGSPDDVGVRSSVLRDPDGAIRGIVATRSVSFYHSEFYLLAPEGPKRLPVPEKSTFREFVCGQLVFSLEEGWTPPEQQQGYPVGALVSIDLDAFANEGMLSTVLIYLPGARESIESVSGTRSRLLVTIFRNVRGSAVVYRFSDGVWRPTPLPMPDNSSISPVATNDRDEQAFLDVAGYLMPNTLFLADAAAATVESVKSMPPRFDASGLVVERFEVASIDGTRIPYFVVRPTAIPGDGSTPTLLYGYGGFQVSMTPAYGGVVGKLWLERGGAYVVANIRGGGEFGPAWHQAALKHNRQRAFDDFIAVAEDLIRRGITSPRRLGIMGGSNGGLLMGAVMTQRPELFNAVVIQVPLLDMLRYHKLLAGASWMAEYGDPDQPEDEPFLRSISPYHNLRLGVTYPEPFFVTSTKDDRVHPGHARKVAAKMAAMGLPFCYYENVDGGHSAAANLKERAHRHALEFTYLTRKLVD